MALIRWAPARELNTVQSEVNRLFNTVFDSRVPSGYAGIRRWIPAIDLVETDGDYVLRADIPGLSQEDVSVEVDDNVLTVSGERKSEHEEREDGYYRVERSSGSFRRSLRLPEGVDAEAIKANVENGVLEVHIPKPAERKPHKVAVTVGGGTEKTIESPESDS